MPKKTLPEEIVKARIEAHEKRQIGAVQIGVEPSDGDPIDYAIMLGSDHLVYCACKSWQYSQAYVPTCKHLERWIKRVSGHFTNANSYYDRLANLEVVKPNEDIDEALLMLEGVNIWMTDYVTNVRDDVGANSTFIKKLTRARDALSKTAADVRTLLRAPIK